MAKIYTKISTIQFNRIGHTFPPMYGLFLPVTIVYFNTEYGEMIYFDGVEKRNNSITAERFHNDILLSAGGKNSGYYEGFTAEKRYKNENFYIEANPNYRLLTNEQVTLLKK